MARVVRDIYLASGVTDMRKSIDGLAVLVKTSYLMSSTLSSSKNHEGK
ncbi:IS66 family insertion sequence element accessory protein TnpB [Alicyclobacillus suci]